MKYFYSLIATFLIGIHIFSLKCIHDIYKVEKKITKKIIILILLSFSLSFIGKYLIFLDCQDNSIIIIHSILNCSVFVTFFLSLFFFNNKVNFLRIFFGIILTIIGFYLIESSLY